MIVRWCRHRHREVNVFTTIGGIDAGDLHSSIVALDFDTTPRDFVTFAAWTPHRYTLSIEENIIPIEFAEEVRAEFIGEVPIRDGDPFAAQFFDYAYMHVLRGPHEGHLLEVPPLRGDLEDRESALIDLVARIPMVRAMARPTLLDSGLLSFLERVAGDEPADRDVRNLLRHCSTTLSPKSDLGSPATALRMWFASVGRMHRKTAAEEKAERFRDAARMADAVLGEREYWVSDYWGQGIRDVLGQAIARLS